MLTGSSLLRPLMALLVTTAVASVGADASGATTVGASVASKTTPTPVSVAGATPATMPAVVASATPAALAGPAIRVGQDIRPPTVRSSAYPEHPYPANLDYTVGVAGAFEFFTWRTDTTAFAWRIDGDGPAGTVAADARGGATVLIAPVRAGLQTLYVRDVTADNAQLAETAYRFTVDDGPRLVDPAEDGSTVLIGSTRTVRLRPSAPHVVSYAYRLNDLAGNPIEAGRVAARADGSADLGWTVTSSDIDNLTIQSVSAAGTESMTRYVRYYVDGAAPTVTHTGGLGWVEPATFTARTRMADPVEYVVVMNHDESTRQVVRPGADGSGTFQLLPQVRGSNLITVFARNAAGVQSDTAVTLWSVSNRPRVTSAEFPANGSGRLAPGSFTFAAGMPGTTQFRYSINGASVTSLVAGADGRATLTWLPPAAGEYTLTVSSVTATGGTSSTTEHRFRVERPVPTILIHVTPTPLAKDRPSPDTE